MLGLKLRGEFLGRRLQGTAIELSNESNTGATQMPAQSFLEITYPTLDLLKCSGSSTRKSVRSASLTFSSSTAIVAM